MIVAERVVSSLSPKHEDRPIARIAAAKIALKVLIIIRGYFKISVKPQVGVFLLKLHIVKREQ